MKDCLNFWFTRRKDGWYAEVTAHADSLPRWAGSFGPRPSRALVMIQALNAYDRWLGHEDINWMREVS